MKASFRALRAAACATAIAACGFPKPADVPECAKSSDCASAAAPYCVDSTCASACRLNEHCQGLSGTSFCQTATGKCVGCLDATACSTDKPVCDATGVCRACSRDDECASGVCVDAEGRCAMASEVVFLAQQASDNATCSAAAPCRSFAAALAAASPQRNILHIVGGTYTTAMGIAPAGPRFTIDGSDTIVTVDQGVAFSSAEARQTITVSRVTINAAGGTSVSATNGGAILLYKVTLGGKAVATGGSLGIQNSSVRDVTCSAAGAVDIEESTVGRVDAGNCGLTAQRDRFNDEIEANGGKVIVENSLIVSQNEVQDGVLIPSSLTGSRFAFNTLVNFSGVDGTSTALSCNAGLDVSSNIFAWHSSSSMVIEGCVPHHSLFDTFAPTALVGANHQGDALTFFVDLNGRDVHLSAASPALRIGEANVVDVDIDGAARPDPAGSSPDAGAYERP
jgi:hypothetical protein